MTSTILFNHRSLPTPTVSPGTFLMAWKEGPLERRELDVPPGNNGSPIDAAFVRGFRRAQLLLGRTLCSAAHSLALNYITGSIWRFRSVTADWCDLTFFFWNFELLRLFHKDERCNPRVGLGLCQRKTTTHPGVLGRWIKGNPAWNLVY